MAVADNLISRVAERPPILSLTVAGAAVQAFRSAPPIARSLEELRAAALEDRIEAHLKHGEHTLVIGGREQPSIDRPRLVGSRGHHTSFNRDEAMRRQPLHTR